MKEAGRKYEEYWDFVQAQLPMDFAFRKESMHDSFIDNAYYEGNNFIMEIDSSHGYTDICKITFKNAVIKAFEFHPNLSWQHTEVYLIDGRYDIQFLTQYGYRMYEENEIIADDILIEREHRDYKAIARELMKKAEKYKTMYKDGMPDELPEDN